MSKTSKYLKYVKKWEEHPDLKDWLSPMAGDIKSAYCKVCRRPLHPHKKDLLLHSKAKKHLNNLERYQKLFSSCQPLKEADIQGDYEFVATNIKLENKTMSVPCSNQQTPKKNVTIAVFSENPELAPEVEMGKPLPDEISDTAAIIISADTSMASSPYSQWTSIPAFKGWLEVKGEILSCKVCNRILKPSKTEVIKHSTGKVHQRKCLKEGIVVVESEDDFNMSVVFNRDMLQEEEQRIIDLRSDTITQPNKDMKAAMVSADIGDDFFGDDPTVRALEEKVSNLLEKECGLFLPSGTMANLVAVMTHCWSRDSEVIVGDESHIFKWSQGGLARLGGIQTKPLKNESDGTFSLQELKNLINEKESSAWHIETLVCIENSHNRMGGRVLPMAWLEEIGELCEEKGIFLHMDGARLMNASLSVGRNPSSIVRHCHTSTFCLNKGLGAPMGSILVGSKEFIEKAKRVRTMLGGTMHQAGLFAAAAIYALENIAPKLHWDHSNARAIAQCIVESHSSAITTSLENVQTNFVHLRTDNIRVNAKDFCKRLALVKENEFQEIGEEVKVMMLPIADNTVRFVTHYDLSQLDIQLVIRKLKLVIEEYDNMLDLNYDKRLSS